MIGHVHKKSEHVHDKIGHVRNKIARCGVIRYPLLFFFTLPLEILFKLYIYLLSITVILGLIVQSFEKQFYRAFYLNLFEKYTKAYEIFFYWKWKHDFT